MLIPVDWEQLRETFRAAAWRLERELASTPPKEPGTEGG